jgi:carbamoyltransferase
MTRILGVSAYYHDSAAALVVEGEIVAAAQQERFSRRKHDERLPLDAVAYCLKAGGIAADQLDYVCFYDNPAKKLRRLLATYLAYAPRGSASFRLALPSWLTHKLFMKRELRRTLGLSGRTSIVFADHHESHAASAFFPSPFSEAAIITCDGVGEWATTTWGAGRGNRFRLEQAISFPHSLGLLYSAFTAFTGFKVNSGEYKLMGLAPYGAPVYADTIREKLVHIQDDGSFRLNMEYFTYPCGQAMTGEAFAKLFGGPPRAPESPITTREMDLAASIQDVCEEIVLKLGRHAHAKTGSKNLCLAGGVALNCVANGRLLREGPFEQIWVQPAAGDAGGALGAALFLWHQVLGKARDNSAGDSQLGSLLGPEYGPADIGAVLSKTGAVAAKFDDEGQLLDKVADLMADGRVVGWFNGRMEFGPRALGSRSIIGDARNPTIQSTMNLKIKFRESFRPFAPCVLRERVHEYFDAPPNYDSPYMLFVADVKDVLRVAPSGEDQVVMSDPDLRKRVNLVRSSIPAITHVDYSARIQTVDPERHGRFYRLMKAFERKTGCGVIVNTSFNIRGEPIVNTPEQAITCFRNTQMDALVLGDFLLMKQDQREEASGQQQEAYLRQFTPD